MRKIVQIAAVAEQIVALCDDGSIWYRWPSTKENPHPPWETIPPIPEDDKNDNDNEG